ncbi:MAG: sensor histidine kinase [Chitinophagales bacterium]
MIKLDLRSFRNKLQVGVPEEYQKEFDAEIVFDNIFRIRVFTLAVTGLHLILLYIDWQRRFLFETQPGYVYLTFAHLFLLTGMIILLILTLIKIPASPQNITSRHGFVGILSGMLTMILCVITTAADQFLHGDISAYMLGCLAIAAILYYKPRTSFVVIVVPFIFFLTTISHLQTNPFKLAGHYTNGASLVLVAWILSILLYAARAGAFLSKKTNQRQAQLLDSILDGINESVFVTDNEQRLIMWNKRAESYFNLQSYSCLFQTMAKVENLKPETFSDPQLYQEWLDSFIVEPQLTSTREWEQVIPYPRTLQSYSAPIGDGSGKIVARVYALRDITREKEVDRMKTDFISTVSHELRTPLTSIMGFAKIIMRHLEKQIQPLIPEDDVKGQQILTRTEENLNIIISEGERLTRLVNNLLDVAKIESGKLHWNMSEVHIGELISSSVTAVYSLLSEKGLTLRTDIEPDLPPIIGDRDRLIQVITNLLSNAIKFTSEGEIVIDALVLNRDSENNRFGIPVDLSDDKWLLVAVTDNGVGISQDQIPLLFQRFQQVSDPLTSKPQGTGLGLAISREIIEHHQGRIWVSSQPGKGSCFAFVLPVQEELQESNLFE